MTNIGTCAQKPESFWKSISIFECYKRLARDKYLALTSFWYSIAFLIVCVMHFELPNIVMITCKIVVCMVFVNCMTLPVRRFHDINLSGWWTLLGGVPVLGAIYLIVTLFFWPGTKGMNRFGEQPEAMPKYFYLMIPMFLLVILLGSWLGIND